jgi:hypothetical protein
MKHFLLPFLFLGTFLHAQIIKNPAFRDTLPLVWIGSGTGINNYCGMLGIGATVRMDRSIYLRLGAGIGGWGRKITAGFKYEFRQANTGPALGLSYSSCSGLKNMQENVETIDKAGIIQKKEVSMDLLRASTLNVTWSYKWLFLKKNNFYIDLGYAFRLDAEPYAVKDGSVLTANGKTFMHTLQPGGIIGGIGIMFGL